MVSSGSIISLGTIIGLIGIFITFYFYKKDKWEAEVEELNKKLKEKDKNIKKLKSKLKKLKELEDVLE